MNRYCESNSNSKPWARVSSERTSQKQEQTTKQSPHVKFYARQKTSDKSLRLKEFVSEHQSERKLPYHAGSSEQRKRSPFYKEKIYRSYSEAKKKLSVVPNSDQFLIRVPKNQNLIQSYIQQLKQLKQKIALEKAGIQQVHKQKQQKMNNFALKLPEKKDSLSEFSPKYDKEAKNEQHTKGDHKIFSRDMKKHMKKLKIFKEFVDQNQHPFTQVHNQNIKKNIQSTTKFQQLPLKEVNEQYQAQHFQSHKKFQQYPHKIIYGDVINVKQEFKIGKLGSDKKFNRYSSESGRKLMAVSKSVNLRQKERIQTEQKIERYNNSRSLVLKRRKTEETHQKVSINASPIKLMSESEPIPIQKPSRQLDSQTKMPQPQQQNTIEQQTQKAMKSIEGYSTIQAKKQTIDMLGESCMEIKKNLVQSNKKMDHILDMLGYDMHELKEQTQRDKKRKNSYERFSKAFPKGFFNF